MTLLEDRPPGQQTARPAAARSVHLDFALAALAEPLPAERTDVVGWLFLQPMQDPGEQPSEWQLFSSISVSKQASKARPFY